MILGFSVSNHRSILREQTVSFEAGPDTKHPGSVISPAINIRGLKRIKVLKSILLYGHNAAGKSNLFHAVKFMREYILNGSDLKQGDPIPRDVFRFSPDGLTKPTSFYIAFLMDGARYDYSFEFNDTTVIKEELLVNDRGMTKPLLVRTKNEITLGNSADSANEHKTSTKSNVLFLSWAAHMNDPIFSKIYLWFKNNMKFYNSSSSINLMINSAPQPTAKKAFENSAFKTTLLSLIRLADLGIVGLSIKPKEEDDGPPDSVKEFFTDKFIKIMQESNGRSNTMKLIHQTSHGHAELDYQNESDGTRRLIALAGPILNGLEHGHALFIDEFEAHLHPSLSLALFKLFNNEITNPNGAQLFIGTHLLELMDQKIIRRDQIYFAEKDKAGSTKYYPMLNYKVRNTESLSRGYLAGRYGAIPRIKSLETLETSTL